MKMEHITIKTALLEESVAFYQKYAGLEIQMEMHGKGPYDIVFLANAKGETCVELIETKDEAYNGTAGLSIGFHVDDVEAYRNEIEAEGLEPTPMISPNPAVKFFFVKDPNGIDIQFI